MNGRHYDLIVTGAGPAGCCTAIGLARHGYSVALLERRVFPRAHIGESLSPGVRIVLGFLGIEDILQRIPRVEPLEIRRTWEHQDQVNRQATHGAFVTDRGLLDQELVSAARTRGVDVFQSGAPPVWDGARWRVEAVESGQSPQMIAASLWIDARGRTPVDPKHHLLTTPASVAVWEDFSVPPGVAATGSIIEALADGWLWGSPTTTGRFRVLAVTDPRTLRTGSPTSARSWLRMAIARSRLLPALTQTDRDAPQGQCAGGVYVHRDPWQNNSLKVGDAAFALDPLASGGVEKAMRQGLQCVVAVHSMLDGGQSSATIARDYYLSMLAESVVHHARWTQECYRSAWAFEQPFWSDRTASTDPSCLQADGGPFATQLLTHLESSAPEIPADPRWLEPPPVEALRRDILRAHTRVRLSSRVNFVETMCVVEGKVIIGLGLRQPGMARPVAFIDGVALAPLVAGLDQPADLNAVVLRWSASLDRRRAMRAMHWLLRCRLLEVVRATDSSDTNEPIASAASRI